ncbi:MAG: lysylphosphatidylglycerol synthase domain-containing protein [Ancrocorticia sp.]|uniref:lysylphosphatidylglycerol synthase domain-containing protein n=1 Tax=Ancrocorticia sp. TaxID=2593684 RepID=UPI003F907A41
MPKFSKPVRYGLTACIVIAVGYLFGRTLYRNWDAVKDVDFSVDSWTVLGILLFALAVVVSGLLWGKMVGELSGTRISKLESIRVHCLSWLLKYIPGQVGSVANKLAWAATHKYPKSMVTLTFIYENVFLVIGSLVPPVVILLLAGSVDLTGNTALLVSLLAIVPLIVLTNDRVFSWGTNLVSRRVLKHEVPKEYFLNSRQSFRYQLWYLIPRVVNGAGAVVIAAPMFSVAPGEYLPIACAYVIAGAVGMMAVMVPSGVGVRESVFVLLVLPYLPSQEAIVLSLATRLWATLADVVVAVIYLGLNLYVKRIAKN